MAEDLNSMYHVRGQVKLFDPTKGFGFVEMPNQEEAEAALDGMEGKDLMGRPLRCNESQPRERR